jgi:broad-specificity NMP kinase
MMITGAPGAGKSLCANTILSKIGCKVIKLNANTVKSLQDVQSMISVELLGKIGYAYKTAPQIISEL